MYQPSPRYTPSHRGLFETMGEYADRLRDEEREFNYRHREEREADQRRFDAGMREAYGEEYPGADDGW